MHDLLIRNGVIAGTGPADIAVDRGHIAAIGPQLPAAREEIDAQSLTIFPGLIDVHLHFNEPGRTEWEGGATGSRALAAGGGTMYFDMPLNSNPCTVSVAAFEEKRAALAACSVTDFALWGGIVPGNRADLKPLADAGVIGFKAFLCNSGLPEFPRADDLTLYEAMQVAARHSLPVAVHAESEEITAGLTSRIRAAGGRDIRSYLASRPVVAEIEAIQRAALLACETGAWLHIVHISSGRGVAVALEARARGANLTIETCPHYLFFTEDDMERIGAAAKCAPPLRPAGDRDGLWRRVLAGEVDMIASDHSPSSPDLKRDPDFFRVWGGIAGVQSTLAVLLGLQSRDLALPLADAHGSVPARSRALGAPRKEANLAAGELEATHEDRGLSLANIVRMTAETPAARFRIAGKGKIAPGYDADLALVDLSASFTLAPEHLHQRHPLSPYAGSQFRGRVEHTLLRGRTIFHQGRITAAGNGRWVRPNQELACTT
ncbi:MAG: allantoinase AllB [Bryobacteraceae bacterium]